MESVDESQIKELIGYFNDPNIKVKIGALDIALQLSTTNEQREAFKNTDIIKNTLRLFTQPQCEEKSLSLLVNFSMDEHFTKQIVDANGVKRIIDDMKEKLIEYAKVSASGYQPPAGLTKEKMEDFYMTLVQLELLALMNMSQYLEAKKSIMEMHREPEFQCVNFGLLLSWYSHPKISPFFHFFGNILANLSAYKETRMLMIQPKYKLLDYVIMSIFSLESNRRKGTLKTLRNCIFEWENPEFLGYLTDPKLNILNNLLRCLAFNLAHLERANDMIELDSKLNSICKKNGIIIDEKDEIPPAISSIEDIEMIIDMFLVLTNVDPEKSPLKFDNELAKELLHYVRKYINNEELLNKIDVINVLFFKEAPEHSTDPSLNKVSPLC